VLGTNSKSLKICRLPKCINGVEIEDDAVEPTYNREGVEELQVVIEQQNHHVGSIYCVDWSRTEHLIATGSNDRLIKLLVCPDLEHSPQHEILEMTLQGH
jgi:WD40 repeat protein